MMVGKVTITKGNEKVLEMDADEYLEQIKKEQLATKGCPPMTECWICPKNRGMGRCLP